MLFIFSLRHNISSLTGAETPSAKMMTLNDDRCHNDKGGFEGFPDVHQGWPVGKLAFCSSHHP